MANIWDSHAGAAGAAANFCTMNVLYLLIEKGLITQEEAAGVFTKTANQVRDGSEDGPNPGSGESIARGLEKMAGWCLGYPSTP